MLPPGLRPSTSGFGVVLRTSRDAEASSSLRMERTAWVSRARPGLDPLDGASNDRPARSPAAGRCSRCQLPAALQTNPEHFRPPTGSGIIGMAIGIASRHGGVSQGRE